MRTSHLCTTPLRHTSAPQARRDARGAVKTRGKGVVVPTEPGAGTKRNAAEVLRDTEA